MLKRILAWIAIIGFIFLIVNLSIFRYNVELFTGIYILIIIFFVFSTINRNQ